MSPTSSFNFVADCCYHGDLSLLYGGSALTKTEVNIFLSSSFVVASHQQLWHTQFPYLSLFITEAANQKLDLRPR